MKNYYEILEVNKKASQEIIDKAYRVLVKKYHPDLYTGTKKQYAESKIKEINEAYNVLSDHFLKEQYDSELEKEEENKYIKNEENQQYNSNKNINNNKKNNEEDFNERMKKHKVGSFGGIIELCRELYRNKPKREEFKKNFI